MALTTDELDSAVVLRRELLAQGRTDMHIQTLVRRGELTRIRHGSYVAPSLWESATELERHRILIRAVLKRAHPSTVVSHISNAVERGAPVWGIPLDAVHVTRSDGRAGRNQAGVVHHKGRVKDEDVELIDGIPLTRAARCAVEVTTQASVESSLVTVNGLLNAGAISPHELETEIEECKYWPHTLASMIVERLSDAAVQSVAESRTMFLCWSHHLPRPECQVPIENERGWVFAYADFAWRKEGVFLEFDGRIKYERYRRPGETLEQYVMREKRREEQICQLTGWVCVRITWDDLAHPERTAARIRRILDSRRGAA